MWRVLGSFATLLALDALKQLGVRGPGVKHFSYGANLEPGVMAGRRIETRGHRAVTLDDHRLVFDMAAPYRGAAYGSVVPAPGERVLGLVVEIDAIDQLRLHCFEQHFWLRRMQVHHLDGAFYYRTSRPTAGLRPTSAYLGKILRGMRSYGISDRPQAQALLAIEFLVDPPADWCIHFVVDDYDALGPLARPLLRAYDALNARAYSLLWNRYHGSLDPDASASPARARPASGH